MDPVPFFVLGLMTGSVGILLAQAFGRRRFIIRRDPTRH
jgi:hypothetical protein